MFSAQYFQLLYVSNGLFQQHCVLECFSYYSIYADVIKNMINYNDAHRKKHYKLWRLQILQIKLKCGAHIRAKIKMRFWAQTLFTILTTQYANLHEYFGESDIRFQRINLNLSQNNQIYNSDRKFTLNYIQNSVRKEIQFLITKQLLIQFLITNNKNLTENTI
jgi:hypothetical protein